MSGSMLWHLPSAQLHDVSRMPAMGSFIVHGDLCVHVVGLVPLIFGAEGVSAFEVAVAPLASQEGLEGDVAMIGGAPWDSIEGGRPVKCIPEEQ